MNQTGPSFLQLGPRSCDFQSERAGYLDEKHTTLLESVQARLGLFTRTLPA
jgi:hypothetical protein